MKKLIYADDLALVANGKQELQDIVEEWNGVSTPEGRAGHRAGGGEETVAGSTPPLTTGIEEERNVEVA